MPRFTWDGLPIAPEEPHGAAIVVRRPGPSGPSEFLILHRGRRGSEYEGDWAWTPPSGCRQPGESVLAAALRELEEESGLVAAAADLRALDLSGEWARFGLDVPAGTGARVDHEHDRLEWVPAAEASSRCRPAAVAAGVALMESAISADISFRPLASADLPALVGWQRAPHAERWFPERLDLAAAERKYRPRIAGDSPTQLHVAIVDDQDEGFLQHYRVGDHPDYAAATGCPDAVGIDYAIGVERLTGRGLGSQLIWSYLRDIVLPAHPAARQVLASPDVDNHRSIRALQKAGFVAGGEIARPDEPSATAGPPAAAGSSAPGGERLCVLDLTRFFGERGSPGIE